MSQQPKLSYFQRRAVVPHREFIEAGPPAGAPEYEPEGAPEDEEGVAVPQPRTLPTNDAPPPPEPINPDLDNVQGDVYYMFPKKWECFLIFRIKDNQLEQFRKDLAKYAPMITSSRQTAQNLLNIHTHGGSHKDIISTGIAFSRAGLNALGKTGDLRDPHFDKGSQYLEKAELGDKGQYDDVFDGDAISHGILLLTVREQKTCHDKMEEIKELFKNSITVLKTYDGRVRVGDGEHFGWRDGISQPAIDCDWGVPKPGQRKVNPGVIIMGYKGDPICDNKRLLQRPTWTKDGAFMVFRKLEQNVLFLEDYINKNWPSIPAQPKPGIHLDAEQRKLLFGAQLVGRYKSGVPLALCPYIEDPQYQKPQYINNFDYTERSNGCPLFAHIRKTEPRNLLPLISKEYLDASVIIRAGIPYGDEVSAEEREEWKTLTEKQKADFVSPRGLLFVCYQSSIDNGFYRQTTGFANNDYFPLVGLEPKKTGQDPIIGGPQPVSQASGPTNISEEGLVTLQLANTEGVKFELSGIANKVDTSATAVQQQFFATSRGGEYYFVPGISTVIAWAKKD